MKDIIKFEIAIGSMNNSFTNVINVHTCTTCSADLIGAVVLVVDDELVEFTSDVVRRPGVRV
jgi:hypothetical protein